MKSVPRLTSVLAALGLSLAPCASALSLSGTLTDLTGSPIPGATVSLALAGTSTTTNANGAWMLGQTTGIAVGSKAPPRTMARVLNENGHLRVQFSGTNAAGQGQVRSSAAMSTRAFGRSATVVDTLLFSWDGSVRQRLLLDSYDHGTLASTPIDTSVLLLRADGYTVTSSYAPTGMKCLTVGIFNLSTRSLDTLTMRFFLQGKSSQIHDLGMRCDIGIKYLADGYQDYMFGPNMNSTLRAAHPFKLDSTCIDSSACTWAIDVPLTGLILEAGTRARMDLMQDRHKVEMSLPPNPKAILYDDLLGQPPSHDIFDTTTNSDWSFRRHVAGSDAGKSPLDYVGIPRSEIVSILDRTATSVREAPYLAIYRKGVKIYGLAP